MIHPLVLLSFVLFLPAFGSLALMLPFWRDQDEAVKWFTLAITVVVFAPLAALADPFGWWGGSFNIEQAHMQYAFSLPWIPPFEIHYFLGLDGISFPLAVLTAFVTMLAAAASWSIKKYVQPYCILLLILETGMLGVFLSLDFFLFYVFWEVMLLPMYFLIGVWGGENRLYAAIKFFLYTLVGSVLMLIAMLMLFFHSDLAVLANVSDYYGDRQQPVVWEHLHLPASIDARLGRQRLGEDLLLTNRGKQPLTVAIQRGETEGADARVTTEGSRAIVFIPGDEAPTRVIAAAINKSGLPLQAGAAFVETDRSIPAGLEARVEPPQQSVHTFNLLALAAMAQHTDLFSESLQIATFLLLLIGFLIKVPAVPVHTWLPDAHVEAPTPISMILAGVLLKMGGYGIIRICYPICPAGGYQLAWLVCVLGVVSMVYGALAALAQTDFKRLVAYSSVSHMGYVLLGLGIWSSAAAGDPNTQFWMMGVMGAMFQMIAHGLSSPGMFFLVGVLYDRVHHRDLNRFGGLYNRMPVYTALSTGIFFAAMGLPGLCGFIGEVTVVVASFSFSAVLAILAAAVVILTAAYILWAMQRVYLGASYNGPHEEALEPLSWREFLIGAPLLVACVGFGVFPNALFRYMEATVTAQVRSLDQWRERSDQGAAQGDVASEDPPQVPAGGAP